MFASRRLIGLAAFGALFLVLGAWEPHLVLVGTGYNCALALALGADYLLSRRPSHRAVTAQRAAPDPLSLGATNTVTLRLRSRSTSRLRLLVKDQPPRGLPTNAAPFSLLLAPGEEAVARYQITPRAKGDYQFGDIGLRLWSPLGLMVIQVMAPAAQRVRVYPNLMAVSRYELLARRGRLLEAGIRAARYRGRGTEFESLRAYLPDDDSRLINWKATARRHQLISSEFQSERSQNLILVLDAGRMMAGRVGEMTKLDYAINAALMSAYVGAAMGDRVGLLAFAGEVRAYLPPRRGRGQVFRLLESLYRLEPELLEPDYDAAFRYLALRQRRRSLVVIFTDLVDPDCSEALLKQVGALHPHHLVLCVTVADADLLRLAHLSPAESGAVYQKAVAYQVLGDREAALSYLRQRGVNIIDVPADQLTAATINRYLELKARSLV